MAPFGLKRGISTTSTVGRFRVCQFMVLTLYFLKKKYTETPINHSELTSLAQGTGWVNDKAETDIHSRQNQKNINDWESHRARGSIKNQSVVPLLPHFIIVYVHNTCTRV